SFLSFPFHMLPPLISTLFPYTTLFRSAYVLSSVATYDQQIEAFEYGRKDPVLLKRNERIMQVYNEFANRPTLLNVLKAMVYSALDRKSTRLNSSHVKISYAVFCLKKKN